MAERQIVFVLPLELGLKVQSEEVMPKGFMFYQAQLGKSEDFLSMQICFRGTREKMPFRSLCRNALMYQYHPAPAQQTTTSHPDTFCSSYLPG